MTATLDTAEFHVPLPADVAEDAQDAQASAFHTIEAIEWSATAHLMNGKTVTADEWNRALQDVSNRIRAVARFIASDYVDEDGGTYDDLSHYQGSQVIAAAISTAYGILARG
ncbi:hypothetical protein [Streptosporangium sp. OZ121]|uniref:hypothetical protein n=1 Tax=Streptosporangium sp. OZ121 TaxID=3444183 RepID=UPI003F7A1616